MCDWSKVRNTHPHTYTLKQKVPPLISSISATRNHRIGDRCINKKKRDFCEATFQFNYMSIAALEIGIVGIYEWINNKLTWTSFALIFAMRFGVRYCFMKRLTAEGQRICLLLRPSLTSFLRLISISFNVLSIQNAVSWRELTGSFQTRKFYQIDVYSIIISMNHNQWQYSYNDLAYSSTQFYVSCIPQLCMNVCNKPYCPCG